MKNIKYLLIIALCICFNIVSSSSSVAQVEFCTLDHEANPVAVNSSINVNQSTTIPVIFHAAGSESQLLRDQLNLQFERLNDAFVNTYFNFKLIAINYDFTQAEVDLEVGSNAFDPGLIYEFQKEHSVRPEFFVNVYFHETLLDAAGATQVLGDQYFTAAENSILNKIWVDPNALPSEAQVYPQANNPTPPPADFTYLDEGKTLIHEMGHYFGLYHTYFDDPPLGDCWDTDPDHVSDTPEHFAYTASSIPIPPVGYNSCIDPNDPNDPIDPVNNYLNITADNLRDEFTNGQEDRMHNLMMVKRPQMVDSDKPILITSNTTWVNKTITGEKYIVVEGATLTITGTVTLQDGPNGETSQILNFGVVTGTGSIVSNGASELLPYVNGINYLGSNKISLTLNSSGACVLASQGGTVVIDGSINFSNGGFIAAKNGTVIIKDDITLSGSGNLDGYVLDVKEGGEVRMAQGADILIDDDAKMRALGTSSNPVKFTYDGTASSTLGWDGIEMRGDGNIFKYTILEGSLSHGLYFRSDDNVVEYSNIRNNQGYGIRTYYEYPSTSFWGSLKVTNSKIENNGNHGVFVSNSHVSLEFNDIKSNDGDGVYINSGRLGSPVAGPGYFRNNDIYGNTSNAVQVSGSGVVYDGYSSTRGYNLLDGNSSHEIYLSSTNARWYDASGGSYSTVKDTPTQNYTRYVYNLAQTTSGESTISWTVGVENNSWDGAAPPSNKFYGSVDYTPYVTGTIPIGQGAGWGVPSKLMGPDGMSFENVVSSEVVSAQTERLVSDDARDYYLDVVAQIQKLEKEIQDNPTHRSVPQKLNGLNGYYNELSEAHKADFPAVKALISGFKSNTHLNHTSNTPIMAKVGERLASETALMLEAHQYFVEGKPNEALEIIREYSTRISNIDLQREVGLIEAASLEQLGRYEEAIRVYTKLSMLSKRGIDPENTKTDYPDEISLLNELIVERDGTRDNSSVAEAEAEAEDVGEEDAMPTEFKLHAAYPNPFNPSTIVSFELPEAGKVRVDVYDISGRLVSVLTNQNYQAGRHTLSFDASNLASGVYLVRANIAGTLQSQKITLLK